MSRWRDRRDRFRALLEGDACVHPASVFDPISARLAEDEGLPLGLFAGSIAALTVLGAPDLVLITLGEFADQSLRISRASALPLLVDADHGYGNALNVRRTVEELEIAGVAALTIEDTALPLAYGQGIAPTLISVEEGEAKMRAALDARSDPALAVIGRTSAPSITGLEDAIARIGRYAAAGVDAVMLVGVRTAAELDALSAAVAIPLLLAPVPPALADPAALAGRGVRICLQGHAPFMAAIATLAACYRAISTGGALPEVADKALLARVTRDEDYARAIKSFLQAP